MVRQCSGCDAARAMVKRPKSGAALCRECFFRQFEDEVHATIVGANLFERGDRVALGVSGGKDSTVLAYVLALLNERHDYGLDLRLLAIDEGIAGYRDDSLATVRRNELQYGIPLTVLSFEDAYGWTMDQVVQQIGTKSNCTFCGVFRRQALNRGACRIEATKIATGHNADDIAETVILNFLRGDFPRLRQCADAVTGRDGPLPRVKPFKYTYEKEIVMYAHHKKLDYFATECLYAPHAYRGRVRELIKQAEAVRSTVIVDIIHAAETLTFPDLPSEETDEAITKANTEASTSKSRRCILCSSFSSQSVCKACTLVQSLNDGTAASVNKRR